MDSNSRSGEAERRYKEKTGHARYTMGKGGMVWPPPSTLVKLNLRLLRYYAKTAGEHHGRAASKGNRSRRDIENLAMHSIG